MTTIDWAIVALVVILVPIGYRQGLLVAGLGLGGFAAGAVLGARLAPLLLEDGSASPYAPGVALLGGLVLGGAVALIAEGVAVALRRRLPRPFSAIDSVGGAVAFAALGVALAWVAGALALNAPALRGVRGDVQRSVILGAVNDVLPPSGPILNVLNRITPEQPVISGPAADVPSPKEGIANDPDVVAAGQSVTRVEGTACGLNVSGSGWVGAPGLVVTNAHVIAGQDDTSVVTREGAELDAQPAVYRPRDDVAVLRVPGLDEPSLPLAADPESGTPGAVLGFPGAGEFHAAPARLGTTGTVKSQNSYGRGPIERKMTSFRAEIESGNSGGPLVGGRGRVLTTVFAATVDANPQQGLGVPNSILRDMLEKATRREREVDSGECL
ncbi:MAG TPA: MarP family serine protease [Solirubrobacterales bacterium]|nr:MarP family serine protease [Solirubrobacterales bacterium]